ncbi:hypothetical protein KUTeg_018731 [Tegillarca granosa]|uniref:Transcriptional coactivator p15 (PC4) C-terminal domain-containing protein n=1 Tax=Tegillarca granosa TaxID=220873 RepID=A0ABQ9EKP4_TEGGR|nr:hypothetical protein KUTeg_018731 [Tegillarca granosa]
MEKIQLETSRKHESNIFKLGKVEKKKKTQSISKSVKDALRKRLFPAETPIAFQDENACDRTLVIDDSTNIPTEIPDDDMTENCLQKPAVIKDNVELCKFGLGENRFVGHNGLYPTKKGIALDLERLKKIDELCYKDVNDCIKAYKQRETVDYIYHLGENVYVSIKNGYPVVNIRKWFLPEGQKEILPTKKGIALTFRQWEFFRGAIDLVSQMLKDELKKVSYCEYSLDHLNQMGFLSCSRCNPNYYRDYMFIEYMLL